MQFGTEIVHPPMEIWAYPDYWGLLADMPWNRKIEEFDPEKTENLFFHNYPKQTKQRIASIEGCESLKYVYIHGQCRQPVLDAVATCPNISHLHIAQGRSLDYRTLKKLKFLRIVGLNGTMSHELDHRCLVDPVSIGLNLSNLPVTLEGINDRHWQNVRCLSFLGSHDYNKITIRSIENLSKLSGLEHITMGNVSGDTPHRLDMLQELPNLQVVNVFGSKRSWAVDDAKRLLKKGVNVNYV